MELETIVPSLRKTPISLSFGSVLAAVLASALLLPRAPTHTLQPPPSLAYMLYCSRHDTGICKECLLSWHGRAGVTPTGLSAGPIWKIYSHLCRASPLPSPFLSAAGVFVIICQQSSLNVFRNNNIFCGLFRASQPRQGCQGKTLFSLAWGWKL